MNRNYMVLIVFLILLSSPVYAEVIEVSNKCVYDKDRAMEYCETELEFKDIPAISIYKADLSDYMTKKEAFSMGKTITNNIIFDRFEWEKDKVKVSGWIKLGTQNYWGIEDLYNSTWWNSTYPYRIPIYANISNGEVTDYPILMNITYNVHIETDFSDLLFSNVAGDTEVYYWIQNHTNLSHAYTYINIPFMNTTNQTVAYMYYGLPNATSRSDIDNTFVYGDDFESYATGSNINGQNLWSVQIGGSGHATINETADGKKRLELSSTNAGTIAYRTQEITNLNQSLETYMWYDSVGADDNAILAFQNTAIGGAGATCNYCYEFLFEAYGNTKNWLRKDGVTTLAILNSVATSDSYYTLKFYWKGANLTAIWSNTTGSYSMSAINDTYASRTGISLVGWTSNYKAFDYIFIRKWRDDITISHSYSFYDEEEYSLEFIENVTYIDYLCIGNYSVRNETFNDVSTLTYNLCDYGCNENNPLIDVLGHDPSFCNPDDLTQMIIAILVVVSILALYRRFR